MAHFAELNENNIVVAVYVIDNNDIIDQNGIENEEKGIELCKTLFGNKSYRQTSYNTIDNIHLSGRDPFRKNYAGIGFTYDSVRDAFIPPQPHPTWIFNEETCGWDSPIPYPNDGKIYSWNEAEFRWDEVI